MAPLTALKAPTQRPLQPQKGEVQVCKRISTIAPIMKTFGIEHQWLYTDSWSRGLSAPPGKESFLTKVYSTPHDTDLFDPSTTCTPAEKIDPRWKKIDAACLDREMEEGIDLGRWSFWHNCQTIVIEKLDRCANKRLASDATRVPGDWPAGVLSSGVIDALLTVDGDTVASHHFVPGDAPRLHPLESIASNVIDVGVRCRKVGEAFMAMVTTPSKLIAGIFLFLCSIFALLAHAVKDFLFDIPMHLTLGVAGLVVSLCVKDRPSDVSPPREDLATGSR